MTHRRPLKGLTAPCLHGGPILRRMMPRWLRAARGTIGRRPSLDDLVLKEAPLVFGNHRAFLGNRRPARYRKMRNEHLQVKTAPSSSIYIFVHMHGYSLSFVSHLLTNDAVSDEGQRMAAKMAQRELESIYRERAPEKLANISRLMTKNMGKEWELVARVRKKYGC
eukprot:jgi/Bigna1/70073/fgenesh1_pg.10_\